MGNVREFFCSAAERLGAAAELMRVSVVSVWVFDAVLKRLDAWAFAGPAGVPDFPRR